MPIFQNPQDETKFCHVLRAYVGEFGPENFVVSVPRDWKDYKLGDLGIVRLEFATSNSVSVRVEWDRVRIIFIAPLRAS